MFKDPPLVEGVLVGGKPVDARRLTPTVAKLPGLKLTYEAFVDGPDGGKLPYYCYLGAAEIAGRQARDPEKAFKDQCLAVRDELAKQPQYDSLTDWVDFQGVTPEGRGNQWKKIRFVSQQQFVGFSKAGQEQIKTLPGVLEIYLHQEAGYLIAIAWRMPVSIEQKVDLAKWAPLVAGCVSIH
jgi:hypothetical protein